MPDRPIDPRLHEDVEGNVWRLEENDRARLVGLRMPGTDRMNPIMDGPRLPAGLMTPLLPIDPEDDLEH